MNKDHIKSLIEQIEFAHERGIKDEHSVSKLAELKGLLGGEEDATWDEKVNQCTNKNQLEALVKAEKQVDIDKRKKLADLKKEALDLA